MTWTNQTKNSSVFTNQPLGSASLTWDEATFIWNDAQGTWDNPYSWVNQTKSASIFTNLLPRNLVAWYNLAWTRRIKLTVGTASSLTDFPLYVDLSGLESDFWSHVQNGGADIRVTTDDRTTEIPREVVSCDTGALTGQLWVKVPTLTTGTVLYIYYGNSAATEPAAASAYGSQAVWSAYTNVYHLNGLNDSAVAGNTISSLKEVTQASDSLSFPGEILLDGSISGAAILAVGQAVGNQKIAQSFVMGATATAQIDILLRKLANTGTLVANVLIAIQADTAGSPSGSNIASSTILAAGWNQSFITGIDNIMATYSLTSLVNGTTYWIVVSQSANDTANHINIAYDAAGSHGVLKSFDGATWNVVTGSLRYAVYKSGYAQLTSNIAPAIQDMAVSFVLKKTDTTYENILSQNSLGQTSGHLEINGQGSAPTAGNMAYRPVGGNQQFGAVGVTTSDGLYHWYVVVRDTVSLRFYVDGVLKQTLATDATGTNGFQKFGAIQNRVNATYSQALTGNLKEMRFSVASLLTANRISTAYNNQSSPSTFYSLAVSEGY